MNGKPGERRRLQTLTSELLDAYARAQSVDSISGAFLPPIEAFDNALNFYREHDLFFVSAHAPRPDVLMVNLSSDNRRLLGKPNQASFFSILSVRYPQHVGHVVTLSTAQLEEKSDKNLKVWQAMDWMAFVTHLNEKKLLMGSRMFAFDYIYSADWITHVLQLGRELPNAHLDDSMTCWKCTISNVERKEWHKNSDKVFQLWKENLNINAFPKNRILTVCIELERRRYCWGHGVARLVTNVFIALHDILPQERARQLIRLIGIAILDETTDDTSVSMNETKRIMKDDELLHRLGALFGGVAVNRPLWPDGLPVSMSPTVIIRTVLFSLRAYYEFAYTPWPTHVAFRTLWKARTFLLGFLAAHSWMLAPTVHFMLNHAVVDAVRDRTAFFALNEAIEAENHVDKVEANTTVHGETKGSGVNPHWKQLLEHESLRRLLGLNLLRHLHDAKLQSHTDERSDIRPIVELHDYPCMLPESLRLPK